MFEIACKIIFCLLIAALLGFIIGYLLGKKRCEKLEKDYYAGADKCCATEKECDDTTKSTSEYSLKDEQHKVDTDTSSGKFASGVAAAGAGAYSLMGNTSNSDGEGLDKVIPGIRPAMLKREDVTPDDLKRIKGVGPKLESTLNELGIFTFDQISSWSEEEVEWVDEYLAFKGRIQREDWRNQAKILSQGGETDFSKNYDEN
ncbi:MAG: hypothetical protein KGV58_00255 [Campylobacteraceae bacterium]|nr:hypothetical protein [Campylobacteraceae bacterium]